VFGTSISTEVLQSRYFDFGFRYFVAGRLAAAESLHPVAANLLHHAIAMFLLSSICNHTTEKERDGLDHNLNRIWYVFKERLDPSVDLKRFDEIVTTLHEFEKIAQPKTMAGDAKSEFSLDEVEALIKAICGASGINKAKPTIAAKPHVALR
jgi:hypothetical protein